MAYDEFDDEEIYELPPTKWDKIKPLLKFFITPKFLLFLGIMFAIYAVVWAVRPSDDEYFYKRGIIYSRRGLYDKSKEEFKLSLKKNPDFVKAQYELGRINMIQDNFDEAKDRYSKVIEINRKNEYQEPTVVLNSHLGLALSYMAKEQLDRAETEIQKAQEIDDKNADIYRVYGRLYDMKNNTEKALESYQKALDISPDSIDLMFIVANIYFEEEKFDQAMNWYNNILKKEPENVTAHLRLGNIYENLGNNSEAEKEYKKVLEIDPENGLGSNALARLYAARGDLEKAIDILEEAVRTSPALFSLYLELTNLYNRIGKYNLTIDLGKIAETLLSNANMIHRRLRGKDPETQRPELYKSVQTNLYYNLGEAYFRSGDYSNASEIYKELLNLNPESPMVLANLGMSYLRQNEPELLDEALFAFEKSIRFDKDIVLNYIGLSELFLKKRNAGKALSYANKALRLEPNNPQTHYTLGNVYFTIGKNREAIKEYKRSIELNDSAPARIYLALLYSQLGQKAQAIEQYEAALKISPQNIVALNNLAWLYMGSNKLANAINVAKKALEISPDSPELKDTLGWIYYVNGNYQKSVELLLEAKKGLPDIPDILYHLGKAYYKLGDYEKAQENLEEAIELNPNYENADIIRETLAEIRNGRKK